MAQLSQKYWKITNSLGRSTLFHVRLAEPYGISISFVRFHVVKKMSKRTVRAAKKIMIAHKYHNQISEFYYPGPGAQSSNFFYVSIPLSVMQGICTAPPHSSHPAEWLQCTDHMSPFPGEELILPSTEPPLRWALNEMTGLPDRSVPALMEPSQFELPLRDIFTLITMACLVLIPGHFLWVLVFLWVLCWLLVEIKGYCSQNSSLPQARSWDRAGREAAAFVFGV